MSKIFEVHFFMLFERKDAIAFEESLKIIFLLREDVDKMFRHLDKDHDGMLSWKEFMGEETTVERTFKMFDENHDGKISKKVTQFKILSFQVYNELCLF